MKELTTLFSQYGVEAFLETTSSLVVALDKDGKLLSWNPAFEVFKQSYPERTTLREFLTSPSLSIFDRLFSTALARRTRTQGELNVADGTSTGFVCLFIPLPDQQILFIAEQALASELKEVTQELQTTKRILSIKETELKAVIAQADEVSHTDALTFLPNRRQIIANLQREVMFSDHYGTPLTVSMLDIDHFKKVNDTYGHPAGDEVLRSLASELREHIRYPDTIGRYGGEEFLIVLPHSTLKAATQQAERLCGHVRDLVIKVGEQQIALRVSIGIAQYKIHKEDWQSLLKRADDALYRAKNNGRDQWMVLKE